MSIRSSRSTAIRDGDVLPLDREDALGRIGIQLMHCEPGRRDRLAFANFNNWNNGWNNQGFNNY